MIKKVIFDLDNSLMDWEEEYIFAITNVIKKLNLNYSEEKIKELDNVLETDEDNYEMYEKEKYCDYLNKKCNTNLPYEFYDMLMEIG